MDFRHSVLIYNPASGRRRNVREKKVNEAREILSQWIPRVDLAPTSRRGHATELAAQALADGADLLVSCGGDGTINEVAGGMVGSDVPLLTLPAGTANVLAEEVEFPLSPEKAEALLPLLVAEKVPYGVVRYENPEPGARHFLLMCGVGVDASIVYHLNTRLKTYIGQGAYWLGSLEQLQRKFEPFQIRIDDETYDSTFALISKSRRYGGRLVIAPHAHLLADEFQVVIFHGDSPLRYVGYLAQIATQTLDQFPDVSFHHTNRVELLNHQGRRVYIEVDGEFAGRLPAVVEIAPQPMTLMLPAAYAASRPKPESRVASVSGEEAGLSLR